MAYKMEIICFQNSFGTIDKNWDASHKIFSMNFFDKFSKVLQRIHWQNVEAI